MADLNSIRQRVEIVADTSGLDKLATAADKASASTKKLSDTAGQMASSVERSEKSVLGVGKAVDAYTRANDPLTKTLASVERGERLISAARAQGLPVTEGMLRAVANARARHEEAAEAVGKHTDAMSLNRMQMLEGVHVLKSFVDQVVAGQSPLRALAVEGGRIGQIFTSGSGGVGGTLKALGSTVAGLATGWVGLTASIVGGLGLAGAAVLRFQSQQERLTLSLNGAGRYAGVSVSGLAGIANAAGARNPALGQGGATDLAAQLAGTGRIGAGVMPGILDLAAPYARGTGQDMAKAGEELAKAFSDPAKGADMLNEKLGFLDARTKEHIESLTKQGNLLGAQQELLHKAADASARLADTTWTIAKGWESISNSIGSAFSRAGGAIESLVNGPTLAEKLATAQGERDPRRRALRGDIGALRLGVAYQEYGQTRAIGGAAVDKATNDLSIQVTDTLKRLLPDSERVRSLNDTIELLDRALKDPAVLGKTPGGAAAVQSALTVSRNQLYYNDPMRVIATDSALSTQAIQAQTGAERALIDARKAEIDAMRSGATEAQAAARALATMNDEIAKSNKAAQDNLRSAQQRAGLVGLTPYQRGRQEIINHYDDIKRDAVTGPLSLLSPADRAMTALDPEGTKALRRAFGNAAPSSDALDDAAALTGGLVSTASSAAAASNVLKFPASVRRVGGASVVRPIRSTAAGSNSRALAVDLGAYDRQAQIEPLREANVYLKTQADLLNVHAGAAGKSTAELSGLIAKQTLLNEYLRQGVPVTASMRSEIDAYGKKAAEVAAQQEALDRTIQGADLVRSGVHDGLRTFVDDLVQGKNAATALKDALAGLGSKLIDAGLNSLVDGLFGKSGTNSGLGGIIGSLFSGFKFADGGVMTGAGPVPLRRYAGGGVANSPQLAMYGEGAKPEAYVPLPDGRRIPVAMQDGGGRGHVITVGGPTLNVAGSVDAATLPKVEAMMSAAIRQHHEQLQRNLPSMLARANGRYAA